MRILIVSNLYPPFHVGGYELGCSEVVRCLQQRGHQIRVLTSHYGVPQPIESDGIIRELAYSFSWDRAGERRSLAAILAKEITNRKVFLRQVRQFKPEICYFWNMTGISMSLLEIARRERLPYAFYISDQWLATWEVQDQWCCWLAASPRSVAQRCRRSAIKPIICLWGLPQKLPRVNYREAQFTSAFVRQAVAEHGKPVDKSPVIHWGIDTKLFSPSEQSSLNRRNLLYVGQLAEHKGVHTALEALVLLHKAGFPDLKLTVVGRGVDEAYQQRLKVLSQELPPNQVVFAGHRTKHEVREIFHQHGILLFTSIWQEPFGITPLEAMAAGSVVIATPTGGSPEVFRHGENALLFTPGDAADCACQIQTLLQDQHLYQKLQQQARETILRDFSLEAMTDKIEASLHRCRVNSGTGVEPWVRSA